MSTITVKLNVLVRITKEAIRVIFRLNLTTNKFIMILKYK